MKLVEQHIIPLTKELDDLCFKSKNLYNRGIYIIRQYYFDNQKYIGFNGLSNIIKQEECYKQLPIKVSQLVIKQCHDSFVSYFQALNSYNKNPSKFTGKPRIPGYQDKVNGRNILKYNYQAISQVQLKKGIINPSGTTLNIPTKQTNVLEVRLIPHKNHITAEIVYSKEIQDLNLNQSNIMALDLGVVNLAAITSNKKGFIPLIVKGGALKSINQFSNKNIAIMKSLLPKGQKTSKYIEKIINKRNNKINYFMHYVSSTIIELCILHDIGTIVIGKNDLWKQEQNNGKRNNQNFQQIPFAKFINLIQYKAELIGVNVILTEESYSSKCSFLDEEEMKHHETYLGNRIKRGLFKSASGKYINADVQGSYNILRKEFPNFYKEYGIEGFVVSPLTLEIPRA